jgi:DNA-binding transcriptional regulator GbsR (MarR family)
MDIKQLRDKVEQHGLMLEKRGMAPVASRVMVFLMLHPEGTATFEEMVAYFKVSKSAVSNALKTLEQIGMVDYETKLGSRKRYFSINMEAWFSVNKALEQYAVMQEMFEDIAAVRGGKDKLSHAMKDLAGFFKMLQVEYPFMYEKWKKLKQL